MNTQAPWRTTRHLTSAFVIAAGSLAAVAGSVGASAPAEAATLRIAMGSPGEAQIAVWESAADAFEAAHDGVTIEFDYQDDDLYSTIGLGNLLSGGSAPDIYFEWAGARLEQRVADGYAADLTEFVENGELGELFDDGAFTSMTVDDQIVMVPGNADVTTVVWYNVAVFEELGIDVPATWAEFLELSAALDEGGYVPLAIGNRDLWAAGNFGSHIMSRMLGADQYDAMMRGELPLDDPSVVAAMDVVAELADAGVVNDSLNAIADDEGAQLFFQEVAAMHPIGSWLVSWAIEEAPDLEFDYFNLPAIEGEADPGSVMAVATGYVVNAESPNIELAVEFLTMFSSPEFTAEMVAAGGTPMASGAMDDPEIDERLRRLMDDINEAPSLIAPPDTGYDLKIADALYGAISEVLGGVSTPDEALATAAAKLAE